MPDPDYAQAIAHAYDHLERELSPDLTYHNYWHTREDVVPSCVRLGQHTGISEEEISFNSKFLNELINN